MKLKSGDSFFLHACRVGAPNYRLCWSRWGQSCTLSLWIQFFHKSPQRYIFPAPKRVLTTSKSSSSVILCLLMFHSWRLLSDGTLGWQNGFCPVVSADYHERSDCVIKTKEREREIVHSSLVWIVVVKNVVRRMPSVGFRVETPVCWIPVSCRRR